MESKELSNIKLDGAASTSFMTERHADDTTPSSEGNEANNDSQSSRKRLRDALSNDFHQDCAFGMSSGQQSVSSFHGISFIERQDSAYNDESENTNSNNKAIGSSIGGLMNRVQRPAWMRPARKAPPYRSASDTQAGEDTKQPFSTSFSPLHLQGPVSLKKKATTGTTSITSRTSQSWLQPPGAISDPPGHPQENANQYSLSSSTHSHTGGPVSLKDNATTVSSSAFAPETFLDLEYSSFSKVKSEVSSVSELIADRMSFCQSVEFQSFLSCKGFEQPAFKAKTYMNGSAHERFIKVWDGLATDSKVSIVFHGTSPHNISNILEKGLDPRRRRGQAYGPGEYFARDPGISVSYCKGGLEMLVFVVVEPLVRHPSCPFDYVVVENNNHQLPLGSITFSRVDHGVLLSSSTMRSKLAQLSQIAERKAQEATYMMHKAEIIQLLIGEKVDVASEKYQKHLAVLCETSRREIAMYVNRLVDVDLVSFYFPELPEPMKIEERDAATIRSVEEAEQDALRAKQALEYAKMGPNANKPSIA